jgi:hypothetical protein
LLLPFSARLNCWRTEASISGFRGEWRPFRCHASPKNLKPDREPFAACGLYRLGGANSFFPGVRANARSSSTAEANDEQQFSRFCIVEPARLIRRRQFAGFVALGLSEFTFACS